MTPNPLLKKLGYSNSDRLVIVHTDDIGMCHAAVQAFQDLWEFGTISSAAVMTPCPWFPATADLCRRHPDIDMGVHATLNAEWTNYRWAPLSTQDSRSGLLDAEGYFHQWHPAVYAQADPAAVDAEVNAQVNRALAAGIDVTHIDSHMGTILHPRFVRAYIAAGRNRRLPNLLPRLGAMGFDMLGPDHPEAADYRPLLQELEDQGVPLLDGIGGMPLEHGDGHLALAKQLLSEVPVGITHFILHPSIDTPELRAICPDWPARVANYQAFMSPELKQFLHNAGIHLIGYRAIREAMRAG